MFGSGTVIAGARRVASWPPGQYHPARCRSACWSSRGSTRRSSRAGWPAHVRKLSEALVRRRGRRGPRPHPRGGEHGRWTRCATACTSTASREPHYPPRLTEFVSGSADEPRPARARARAGREHDFDLVHGHDWLVAGRAKRLADRIGGPFVATVHATEHGRHQGWVDKPPQSDIHRTERWMATAPTGDRLLALHARPRRRRLRHRRGARAPSSPTGSTRSDLQPVHDLDACARRSPRPTSSSSCSSAGWSTRRASSSRSRRCRAADRARRRRALPRRRLGHARGGAQGAGRAPRPDEHGTFLGWIGDDVLHSLYRIADLTVVPSLYEPFGLVALEAMASGCPCIVADTGGLREVVPERATSACASAPRPASLARMVERVLTDDALRDRLVAEASEHVLRFDWSDVARQTHAAYRSLLGATAPSASSS